MSVTSDVPAVDLQALSLHSQSRPTFSHLTPEASLYFVLHARKFHSHPTTDSQEPVLQQPQPLPQQSSSDFVENLPALRMLVRQNRHSHADALDYWCDSDASLLASQQHASPTNLAPKWPLEADAAAAEDALFLSKRVTTRCLSVRNASATTRFDAAALKLLKTCSYAASMGHLMHRSVTDDMASATGSVKSSGKDSSDADDDDDSDSDDTVAGPLRRDEALKRYQHCCLVFSADPLPTVIERLRRLSVSPKKNANAKLEPAKDTAKAAPLAASLGSTVTSSSSEVSGGAVTSLNGSAAAETAKGDRPRHLPSVDYVAVTPKPSLVGLQPKLQSDPLGACATEPPSPISQQSTDLAPAERPELLDVSYCSRLGEPDAFVPFLGFLQGLVYLRAVNLSKTDMQNACFTTLLLLCEAYLPNMDDLDVSYNVRLSDGSAASVFAFLRQTPTMRRLHVKGTAMRPATIARIEHVMRRRSLPSTLTTESTTIT